MPRLPGAEALGGVPSARSGRPIATIDTSAIGRGVEAFGRAVQDVGLDLKARHDQTAAFEAERKLQEFLFNEQKLATEAIANIPPGAPGFSDQIFQAHVQRSNAFAEENLRGLSPEATQQLRNRIVTAGQNLFFGAADAERAEITRYNLDALGDVLSTLKTQIDIGGHTSLETYQAEGERLIMASALSPVEKAEQIEKWRDGAAAVAWEAQLRNDPTGALQALGFEPTPGATYNIPADVRGRGNAVYDAFIEYGYSPAQAAAIVGHLVQESGIRPSGAVGDGGTAFGLAQWRGERFEALKRFAAARGTEWTDFQTQIAFIDHELRTTESTAGNALRAATTVEEAVAAFMGFERPQGWTPGNPRGGHGWDNRLAAAQTIAGDPTTSVRMIDPRYQNVSFETRDQLLRAAGPVITQMRRDYVSDMTDYTAYLRSGGAPTDAYNPQQAMSIMGPEGAAEIASAIREAENYGKTMGAIAFASPEELNAIATEAAGRLSNPEGFVENQKRYQEIATAITERNKAIAEDPAAYVMAQPTVSTAYDAMREALQSDDEDVLKGAPGLANAYAVAAMNEQDRLGVPEDMRTILPANYRDDIVAEFNSQEEGGQNAAQLMHGLQQTWGRHWPQVFKELSEDGELPGVALVIGTMGPGKSVAAERLAEAALVGITELEKTVHPDSVTHIDDNLAGTLSDFASTVIGLPGGERTLGTFNEAVNLLALSYVQGGEDPGSALTKAFNDILGDAYEFRDGYRVPVEKANVDIVAGGTVHMLTTLPGIALDIEPVPGMTTEDVRAAYVRSLQTYGTWRTNEDETGLTLYNQAGRAVTVGGKPLTASWADLSLAAGLSGGGTPTMPETTRGADIGAAIGAGLAVSEPAASPMGETVRTEIDAREAEVEAAASPYTDAEQLDIITRARDEFWAKRLTEAEFRQVLEDAGISWDDRGRTR